MSVAFDEVEPAQLPPRAAQADTLAASVVILLVMTVAQRLIGFGRGIFFCRWLDAAQLGQWDVAFGFLNLAAPLAVLGLPGSFGRYAAYFSSRGQFRLFLKRTALCCGAMSLLAAGLMISKRQWFSQLIFGEQTETSLVVWLAICLVMVIAHNFLTALFIAVRRYRIVTVLQFVQSLGFAVIGLSLLAAWPMGAVCAVIAYGAATLLSGFGAWSWIGEVLDSEPAQADVCTQWSFWSKLAPFAVWMWVTNLLANLFDVIDRYMIIHHSGMPAHEALEQVGYYHSSRIVPLLFVSVAGLLGSMITPHLSHDWELGRREAVVRRLNLVLKGLLYGLLAASVAVLWIAPWLFNAAFQDKFAGGLVVLPLTLTYCAWFGTIAVAQNYLWCVEKVSQSTFAIFAGLVVNVLFNLLLLPRYGLEGAVWATTIANLVTLVLIYLISRWHGMHVDLGTWVLTFALLALSIGPWVAAFVLLGVTVAAITTPWLLVDSEKRHLSIAFRHGVDRLKRLIVRRPRLADATSST